MLPPEIRAITSRLGLSPGDLLALAREVSEDRTLRSVADLTSVQRLQLLELLQFLAQPCAV